MLPHGSALRKGCKRDSKEIAALCASTVEKRLRTSAEYVEEAVAEAKEMAEEGWLYQIVRHKYRVPMINTLFFSIVATYIYIYISEFWAVSMACEIGVGGRL